MNISKLAIVAALAAFALPARAQLIFTIEAAGVQASTVSGVTTETFDGFGLGGISGATAIGTLSSGLVVYNADQYGGAFGSKFVRPTLGPATLTFSSAQNYFGIWWSAGDFNNFLEFFDGAASLGVYQVGNIIPFLSSAYYGNPNDPAPRRNMGEPYAYLNFTTQGTTHITSVKFSGGNFEFDNLSITDQAINAPGTLPGGGTPPPRVPDGGFTLALVSASLLGLSLVRRRFRA